MGDFLGSYYTDFLEDEGMSGRMALLKAEQPASILPMERLVSRRGALSSTHTPSARRTQRITAIDDLHIRPGLDDFTPISRACSAEDPDFVVPVASMSLFEQESLMVSVQLKSLSPDSKDREWLDVRVRSRSTELAGRTVKPFAPRARTEDFDIEPPTSGTDGSFTTATPRTGDSLFSVGKRASIKTSLLRFIGRKKKCEARSKRK